MGLGKFFALFRVGKPEEEVVNSRKDFRRQQERYDRLNDALDDLIEEIRNVEVTVQEKDAALNRLQEEITSSSPPPPTRRSQELAPFIGHERDQKK